MLSLTRGIEIAIINEGKMKNKKIFLYGKDDFTMIHQLIIELKKTEIHFIKRDNYFTN